MTKLSTITNTSQIGQLEGCYSLASNVVNVYLRERPLGGKLTAAGPVQFCEGEGEVSLQISRNTGAFGRFGLAAADGNQEILTSNAQEIFNTTTLPEGTYVARHVSYEQGVDIAGVTQTWQLKGCYTFSDKVFIHVIGCAEANLTANPNPAGDISRISLSSPVQGYNS